MIKRRGILGGMLGALVMNKNNPPHELEPMANKLKSVLFDEFVNDLVKATTPMEIVLPPLNKFGPKKFISTQFVSSIMVAQDAQLNPIDGVSPNPVPQSDCGKNS